MRSAHLLPEQSEGKTKMMKQQSLPFTVLKLIKQTINASNTIVVATVLTVYGIETTIIFPDYSSYTC